MPPAAAVSPLPSDVLVAQLNDMVALKHGLLVKQRAELEDLRHSTVSVAETVPGIELLPMTTH